MMERRWWKLLWIAPVALFAMTLFVALGGYVVRSLWNWLLPSLFGWPVITFWQALGLLVLCRLLFGGLGLHGGPGSRAGMRMRERWERMTPEERSACGRRWASTSASGRRRAGRARVRCEPGRRGHADAGDPLSPDGPAGRVQPAVHAGRVPRAR